MKHAKIYGVTLAIVGLALIFLVKYFPEVFGGPNEMLELKVGLIPLIFIIIFVLGVALSMVKEKKAVEIPKPPK